MTEDSTYNLKTLIVGAIGIIVGLACILVAEGIERADHPLLLGLLEATAVSLLTGSFLGLGYEFLLRRELMKRFEVAVSSLNAETNRIRVDVDQRLRLSRTIDSLGLAELCPRENHYDYTDMFANSKVLYFAFNDGRTWFSNHEHDLNLRAEKSGCETHVVLVSPESPFIEALGAKVGQSPDELRKKIAETVRMISRLPWGNHKARVYGHSMPTSYSLVMNEEQAVFIPYPMARKADKVPCFIFSALAADGFYASLRRDLEELIKHPGTHPLHPPAML